MYHMPCPTNEKKKITYQHTFTELNNDYNRSTGSSDICYKKDDIKVKDDQEQKETIQETCTSMAS